MMQKEKPCVICKEKRVLRVVGSNFFCKNHYAEAVLASSKQTLSHSSWEGVDDPGKQFTE